MVLFIGKFFDCNKVVFRYNIRIYLLIFFRMWKGRKDSFFYILRVNFLVITKDYELLGNNCNKILRK